MSPIPLLLTILAPYILPVMASTPAPSSLPQVDFSKMGTVGLGGAFAGLDWFSSSSTSSSTSPSASFSTTGDTLFSRDSNGNYRPLGNTNAKGLINTICWANSTDTNGTLYIGGTFTSLGSTPSTNIASYSISSGTFTSLSNGLAGSVNTLFCDNANGQVWAGGEFSAPSGSSGGNVALWSTSSLSWASVPFGGLNGPVDTISSNSDGSSVYFGGHFTTSFLSNTSIITNSTTNTTSSGNITSIPSAPANTSTVGNSGYLTPVTVPLSSSSTLTNLTIQAGPGTKQNQYNDPNVLLCPGKGVWLAQDQTISNVDIVGYNYLRATGARVTNGLVEGRGATTFCITSLPDNTQLNMTYTDPATGKNETCWEHCPLSTDPNVVAQDYLFTDGARNLTGLQMQLKGWIGDGAGLSSVQLLSPGAYSSAVSGQNFCSSSGSSPATQQDGDWKVSAIATNIPATTTEILTATVPTSDVTYPSVTFYPEVSSSANYDIYVLIPGCTQLQDCAARTSVDIEVFPVQGGLGWTSTISQQVQDDTKTLVYSGPVDASTSGFNPTVSLALAQTPAGVASGNNYIVVAQAIELVLTSVSSAVTGGTSRTAGSSANGTNTTTSTTNSTMTTNSTVSTAFGVFEYVRSSSSSVNAATPNLPNTTETALTRLGFGLDAAYNASSLPSDWTVNAFVISGNTAYVGGQFSSGGNSSNIISIDITTGQATELALQGLNGEVYSAASIGGKIYFGGDFTSTAASGGNTLTNIACWDPKGRSWSAVGGGVNGVVTGLTTSTSSNTQLIVTGNFTNVLASDGTSTQTGGYAIWDTSKSAWTTSGALFGTVSTAAVPSAAGNIYLAGKVSGASNNPVTGVAMLSTTNGATTISSLSNVNFTNTGSASSSSGVTQKRSHHSHGSLTRNWLSRFTDSFASRSVVAIQARATASTIPVQPAVAPAVLAGAFWTNTSASDRPTVTILGGNFTSSTGSGEVEGMAFYNTKGGLSGPQSAVQGVVRTLAVIGNDVYVGGSGVSVTGVGSGLLVYNLQTNSWLTGGMPSLNPATGSQLAVNAIRARPDSDTVIVAGNFATAGSLSCAGMCLWDSRAAQWSTPGSGLSSGEIRAIDFAGEAYDTVVVAGSFVLSTDEGGYIATYSLGNSTWTNLAGLPGPALAVAVDNKNASNIFAAGYATDNTPYLQQWDGLKWTAQNGSLLPGSIVQQLAFVPMYDEHTAQGSIEGDRMLMVSGDLYLQDSGNVTSALYDGEAWHPYLIGTAASGGLGSASSLFWSENTFSFDVRHYLARGLVVLVAIAIATGLILLLILLFFLFGYLTRRSERKRPVTNEMYNKDGNGSDTSSTHQTVFNNVQAALEASLVGGGAGAVDMAKHHSDPSTYNTAPVGSDGEEDEEEDDGGRESTMRYDFDGPELQPGEMAMRAGQRVLILDDVQSEEWWYARDPVSGREGVVPATYVW